MPGNCAATSRPDLTVFRLTARMFELIVYDGLTRQVGTEAGGRPTAISAVSWTTRNE